MRLRHDCRNDTLLAAFCHTLTCTVRHSTTHNLSRRVCKLLSTSRHGLLHPSRSLLHSANGVLSFTMTMHVFLKPLSGLPSQKTVHDRGKGLFTSRGDGRCLGSGLSLVTIDPAEGASIVHLCHASNSSASVLPCGSTRFWVTVPSILHCSNNAR